MTSKMNLQARDKRGNQQNIILKTEPQTNIPGFILANSLCRTCEHPAAPSMPPGFDRCTCPEPGRYPVLRENEAEGRDLIICGAGPSLARLRSVVERFKGDVWGCNRALNYLHEWGVTKAVGVAIDPSNRMFGDVWRDCPDTTYYLATSVNPGLVWWLERHDRPIRYWHSFRGAKGEVDLYRALYPDTVLAGHGVNVVNRAVDLAEYMGYRRIQLAGADNALGAKGEMYADGSDGDADDVVLEGTIGKRHWRTKSDMLASAVALVQKQRAMKDGQTLGFLGDTLPKALQHRSQAFLDRCVSWGQRA